MTVGWALASTSDQNVLVVFQLLFGVQGMKVPGFLKAFFGAAMVKKAVAYIKANGPEGCRRVHPNQDFSGIPVLGETRDAHTQFDIQITNTEVAWYPGYSPQFPGPTWPRFARR